MKSLKEILAPSSPFESRFIPDLEHLKEVVRNLQHFGFKVVLVLGVYDGIHINHKRYLEDAKQHGDILVVGVDTDELTRARKGKSRPIVPELERLEMLTAMRCVDIVTLKTLLLTEEDPGYLCKALRPDVYVTSHSTKDLPEEQKRDIERHVGRIVTLEPKGEESTTSRINKMVMTGAEELQERIQRVTENFFNELKGVKK